MKETLRREKNIHRKVLLVDDELINRQILGVIIGKEYDVIEAENGEDALKKIEENQNTISLILLDLLMPKMDGYQLLQKIQESDEYRRIPVIVLTADKEAEVKCLSLGATDFMPKPYEDPKVIVARCRKAIQLAEDRILINENERDALTGLYSRLFFHVIGNKTVIMSCMGKNLCGKIKFCFNASSYKTSICENGIEIGSWFSASNGLPLSSKKREIARS